MGTQSLVIAHLKGFMCTWVDNEAWRLLLYILCCLWRFRVLVYLVLHDIIRILKLKASAHSFKRFTSRLLKLSFSLYAPMYLGWASCLISFAWDQSTCQERVESDKIQNEQFLPTVGLEPTTLSLEVWCSTYCASRACRILTT